MGKTIDEQADEVLNSIDPKQRKIIEEKLRQESHRSDELIKVIHLTEQISKTIHNAKDKHDLYNIAVDEVKKGGYDCAFFELTDEDTRLRLVRTTKNIENLGILKFLGIPYIGFGLDNAPTHAETAIDGITRYITMPDAIHEALPKVPLDKVLKLLGFKKNKSVMTPLRVNDRNLGIFAITSPEIEKEE